MCYSGVFCSILFAWIWIVSGFESEDFQGCGYFVSLSFSILWIDVSQQFAIETFSSRDSIARVWVNTSFLQTWMCVVYWSKPARVTHSSGEILVRDYLPTTPSYMYPIWFSRLSLILSWSFWPTSTSMRVSCFIFIER